MLERILGKASMPLLLVGVQTCTAALEISMAISNKIRKQSTSRHTATSLFGIYPKGAHSYHKDMCSTMFIAALFIIGRTRRQPRCPSTKDWIKKMWYIYTMEYYTVVKKMTS